MDALIIQAAQLFNVPIKEIIGERRTQRFVEARFAVAYALRQRGWTLEEIGEMLGGRDHTTIIHSIEQAEKRAAASAHYAQLLTKLAGVPAQQDDTPIQITWDAHGNILFLRIEEHTYTPDTLCHALRLYQEATNAAR